MAGLLAMAVALLIFWQPPFAFRWAARLFPDVLFFVETDQPVVALTIDDGPYAPGTPRLLDLLAEHDARATFFLIGDRIPGNDGIVHRIVREGHEVANHHMADSPSIALSPQEFERQLLQAHALLSPYGLPRWFRPASGGFTRRMLDDLEQHGYTCVLGSAYLEDHLPYPWYLSQHILFNARPGSIVILHDGPGRSRRTAEILARVLPELRRRGYEVVTVSELVARRQTGRPGR